MEKIDKSRFAWVGSDPEKREGMARPSVTYWKDAIGRLKKNRVAMVCLCIIILLILSCVIIPWVTPFDSREQHLSCSNKGFFFSCVDERYEGQNLVHVFGTDRLGRDLLVRTFEGGRVSLMIAFAAVAVNLVVGMIYGGISGYFGGLAGQHYDAYCGGYQRHPLHDYRGAADDGAATGHLHHGYRLRHHRLDRHGPPGARPVPAP